MNKRFWKIFAVLTVLVLGVSCSKDDPFAFKKYGTGDKGLPAREEQTVTRRVMLLYSAGYNSLSSALLKNIDELCTGYVPYDRENQDVILVFSHHTVKGSYYTTVPPVLMRIKKDRDGNIIRDTLKTYPSITNSVDASSMNLVLSDVKDMFPAAGYGMVFSSHASGWLPEGYYNDPSKFEGRGDLFWSPSAPWTSQARREGVCGPGGGFAFVEFPHDPSSPAVKSVGQCVNGTTGHEMTIQDFAAALPMKFDYIIFDACLMGCIETAYELKDKCDIYVGSPTEILSQGFFYETLAGHLFEKDLTAGIRSVCSDYFDYYSKQSGDYRSATICMIDCSKLEPVAQACRAIYANHRSGLDTINASAVQGYFRYDRHYFYDLRSMAEACKPTAQELENLDKALGGSIIYKAATDRFIGITINEFSGLSSYIPAKGSEYLDNYYKTLAWNSATDLVK